MRLDADTPETWHRQKDELGNGRTNPVFFRDFDRPQTEFPEKIDLILLFSLTVTQSMRLDADTPETWHRVVRWMSLAMGEQILFVLEILIYHRLNFRKRVT